MSESPLTCCCGGPYAESEKPWHNPSLGSVMKLEEEDKLVARINGTLGRIPGTSSQVRLGMGDDAALFRPRAGHELILTCDWFLEGTHFLRESHPPDSVGWKCLARALSDIAAMGGTPRCFLLSLALPTSCTGRWLYQFLASLRRASRRFHCALAGGDTTRREKILVNVTAVGEVRVAHSIQRRGARPGDLIYVSGRLGEAEWGLRQLKSGAKPATLKNPALKKHLYPEPRLALGQWLGGKRLPTAMMDLSDGLSTDLPRLCAVSGVGARLDGASLPVVQLPIKAQNAAVDPLRLALHGGDDYELLFTVRPKQARLLPHSFHGLPITPIGVIASKKQIVLLDKNGRQRPLEAAGWDPFRKPR
jgi:thiamine-monophosphate kinase